MPFADMDEVEMAYQLGQVEIHSEIKMLATTWYDDEGNRMPEQQTRILEYNRGPCALQPHPA